MISQHLRELLTRKRDDVWEPRGAKKQTNRRRKEEGAGVFPAPGRHVTLPEVAHYTFLLFSQYLDGTDRESAKETAGKEEEGKGDRWLFLCLMETCFLSLSGVWISLKGEVNINEENKVDCRKNLTDRDSGKGNSKEKQVTSLCLIKRLTFYLSPSCMD